MFTELTEELLDLSVHESGYRNALYAQTRRSRLFVQRLVVQPDLLQALLELSPAGCGRGARRGGGDDRSSAGAPLSRTLVPARPAAGQGGARARAADRRARGARRVAARAGAAAAPRRHSHARRDRRHPRRRGSARRSRTFCSSWPSASALVDGPTVPDDEPRPFAEAAALLASLHPGGGRSPTRSRRCTAAPSRSPDEASLGLEIARLLRSSGVAARVRRTARWRAST